MLIWSKGKSYYAHRILSDNYWRRFTPYDSYYLEESGLSGKSQLALKELLDKIDKFKTGKILKNDGDDCESESLYLISSHIIELLKKYRIRYVTDISHDTGILSRCLLQEPTMNRIIYIDKDEDSIDQLYNSMKSNPRARDLNVFLMNILAPIDNYGPRSAYSRVQSDAVVALSRSNKLLLNEHAPIEVFLSAIKKCT